MVTARIPIKTEMGKNKKDTSEIFFFVWFWSLVTSVTGKISRDALLH